MKKIKCQEKINVAKEVSTQTVTTNYMSIAHRCVSFVYFYFFVCVLVTF